jgi:membrane protein DedA with SNARE-associated domain
MLERELFRYEYLILLLGSVIEGDASVLSAAFLSHRGYFTLPLVILTAAFGTTVINQFYYFLARTRGRESLDRKAARHHRYRRVQLWMRRRGSLLMLFSRFIYGLRIAIPAACGAVGMAPTRFFILNVVGAFVWAIPIALMGYFFGQTLTLFFANLREYDWWIAGALLLGVAVFLLIRHLNDVPAVTTMILHPSHLGEESTERLEGIYRKVESIEKHHHERHPPHRHAS